MDKFITDMYDELVDMSKLNISSHALLQYNLKCFPQLGIIEVTQQMRGKLKCLKKIEPTATKSKHKNSSYYIDNDDIIYVVCDNTVITTYPKERIFKAKPLMTQRKCGFKWL